MSKLTNEQKDLILKQVDVEINSNKNEIFITSYNELTIETREYCYKYKEEFITELNKLKESLPTQYVIKDRYDLIKMFKEI